MAKRILVVDDSPNMCKIITMFLEKDGYEIVGRAADGEIAIKLFSESRPDVVTLDLHMPGLRAGEIIKKMKKIHPKTKIFVISALVGGSGEDEKALILEASQAGADEFLSKPFTPSRMLEIVRKLTGE